MEELSTAPIPGPIRTEDHRQPRAPAKARHSERRQKSNTLELETNEQDEPAESAEPEHHVDISV
jgi:hypothetical protein